MSPRSASASISPATNPASSCSFSATYPMISSPSPASVHSRFSRRPAVTGDDGVRRRQDGLGGAVVLLQQDRGGVGVVALEVLDVADGGPAERIDRLIGVADHAQFAGRNTGRVFGGFRPRPVRAPARTGRGWCPGTRRPGCAGTGAGSTGRSAGSLQHADRLADQIVEVQRVGRPQPTLVLAVDLRDDARQFLGGLRRLGRGLRGIDQLVLQVGDAVGQQPR